MATPRHYSAPQIALHWIIAVLVALQFISADRMEEAWQAWRSSGDPASASGGTIHAVVGVTILILAALRLAIRLKRGAPPVPETHPTLLRGLAYATHFALYAFLFFMPVSGAAAWFGGIGQAAAAHALTKNFLLAFVALHVVGALAELAVFRTNSVQRMLGIEAGR